MPNDNGNQQSPAALNPIRPAVIIGAGGVGKEVLMRIRRIIVENYGSLANLPIVQFLHVDTDTNPASATTNPVLGEDISFRADERLELSQKIRERIGPDIEQVRKEPRINRWLPDQINVNQDFSTGAGGVRALGRLCFVYNVDDFRNKLQAAATRACNPNSAQTTWRMTGQTPGNGLDVYFVCSLFGGTGSGSFLEVFYNTREQLQSFKPALVGYLIIGGNALNPLMKANCYGALKELEYFFSSALDKKAPAPEQLKPFEMEYPVAGIPRLTSKEFPLDVCYLADWRNEAGLTFNKEQLEENLARNLFLEFTPGISNVKRGKRIDIMANGGRDNLEEKQRRFQGFFTFGLSILEFPALRIRDCLAYGLAAQAAQHWLFDQAPNIQNLPGEAEAFLRDNGLLEGELLNGLLLAGGEDLRATCAKNLKTQRAQLDGLIERADFDKQAIVNAARGHLEHNRALVTFDFDPKKCGGYVAALQERKREKLRAAGQALKLLIAEMAGNQFEGSRNALVLLNDLIGRLNKLADQMAQQFATHQKSAHTAQQEVERRFEMLVRDASPKFRAELKYHNEKLHDEAQQNFLTKALKREAYRFAHQLLREDLTVNGQTEPCLLAQFEALKERLESYRARLAELTREFERERGNKEENLLKTEIATGINVTAERLQIITKQLLPNVEQESHRLLAEVQNELGEKDATGNVLKPKPIFLAVTEDLVQVKKLLVQTAQRRCDRAREHSIAKELAASPQLANIIRNQFDQATVLAQTSGLEDQTAHIAAAHHFRWVGTGNAQNDSALNAILGLVPENNYRKEGFGVLSDPYQLIFAEEKGIFPLRCLPFLRDYERHYKNQMRGAQPIPRETDKRINFRDLFPEPEPVKFIRVRAEQAALLGQVFGFLHEAEDPATHYPAIYLSYYDEAARNLARANLCREWEAVAQTLGAAQQAKEVEQENVFEATPLELLEHELEKKGRQAATRTDRERLWLELQTYLDGLRARFGDLHPEYARQRKILQAFRERHSLQAPRDFNGASPVNNAPPTLVNNAPPAPASEPTASASELPPPPDGHKHAASFRKKVRAALAAAPVLDDALRGRLLKNGTEFWQLPATLAQQILQEESATQRNGDAPASRARYREMFLLVLESGGIEADERARLQEEQQTLGLSREAVQAIEYPHTSELYRRLLEEAFFDAAADDETRAVLRERQAMFDLTDTQARQLETEYLAQTEKEA